MLILKLLSKRALQKKLLEYLYDKSFLVIITHY